MFKVIAQTIKLNENKKQSQDQDITYARTNLKVTLTPGSFEKRKEINVCDSLQCVVYSLVFDEGSRISRYDESIEVDEELR